MTSWLQRHLDPDLRIRRRLLRSEDPTIEDEVIVDDVIKHHKVAYVRSALWAALGVLLFVLGYVADLPAGWVLVPIGVLTFAGYQAVSVWMDRFAVTNMRVLRVHGVFSEYAATMPLSRILDITVHKSPMGRLLVYADFTFETAAQEQGLRVITTVPHPDDVETQIQRVVQKAGLRGPRVN